MDLVTKLNQTEVQLVVAYKEKSEMEAERERDRHKVQICLANGNCLKKLGHFNFRNIVSVVA